MTASQPRRWLLWIGGIVALAVVGLLLTWQAGSGAGTGFRDRLDSALISIEHSVTGERSEPTPQAAPFLNADLDSAVQALLGTAEADRYSPYEEFPKSGWPADLKRLNPVAIVYFDSKGLPDADGVIIVVDRHRDWDAGILICRQRNSEWQGVHLNGQVMSAGPDFGFRRLKKDGVFWHWYQRNWTGSQPGVAANRSQPIRSETNRTSAAAGSDR